MTQCSVTKPQASKNWPEGLISAKVTMNPYLYAMAIEKSLGEGVQPWELINVALWEKLGKPDHDTLLQFAANLEIADEDPKWLKRLMITARAEVAMAVLRQQRAAVADQARSQGNNGD